MNFKTVMANLFNNKKDIQAPDFNGYFPSEEDMNKQQLSFYKYLEGNLTKGHYVDINGNIAYVFVYLYKLLSNWDKRGFDSLSEFLIHISEIYRHEKKLSDYCLFWAHDCLLGLNKYEEYLAKTEPNQITGTSTHVSNLRLNIQKKLGIDANPIDLLLMAGGRKTKFITNNEALYKDKIVEVFNSHIEANGSWFSQFTEWLPNDKLYSHSLFAGAPIWISPELEFKLEAFYTSTDYRSEERRVGKEC